MWPPEIRQIDFPNRRISDVPPESFRPILAAMKSARDLSRCKEQEQEQQRTLGIEARESKKERRRDEEHTQREAK